MTRIAFIDYETYWSDKHSLSKMNPIEYVMHPETEIQSVSIAYNNYPIDVFFGEERIRKNFAKADWSDTIVVAHNNSGFDALIHAWRFGIKPLAWGCTLAMAKPFYALTVGGSLKKVSEAMGLGEKGSLDAVNTKGKKLKDFTPEEIEKMRIYNKQDTHLCREIFNRLAPRLGKHELKLIDLTIRMTVEPEFEADIDLLADALSDEKNRKITSLFKLASLTGTYQAGMSVDQAVQSMRNVVMSQPQFAGLLTTLGAETPMKPSPTGTIDPTTGMTKLIPALAKSDEGMTDLLEYQDPDGDEEKSMLVQVAAATRLEVKSTQLETRLQTYLTVAGCLNGKLPMPLNYCGAAISWRMSGNLKMNVQNMPRVDDREPKASDALRQSLVAPEGKIIVVVDSSNIELRCAHGLAGQHDTIEKLRNGEDLYCWFASMLFGRTITKADTAERFIGKVAMLSLQYGASWKAFQNMARVLSKGQTLIVDEECKRIVAVWRAMFKMIAGKQNGIWKRCDAAITAMFSGDRMVIDSVGLCSTDKNMILTPNNHWLQYPELRKVMNSSGKDEWKYGERQNISRIYGAHLFENLCQHIARLIVMEQTLNLAKYYPVKLSCHDEAVMIVDEDKADAAKEKAVQIFSTSPKWWPDVVLSAEAGSGYTYADAK